MNKPITACSALLVVLVAAPSPTFAEVELEWGAFVENDLRAAVDRVDEPGINRNQTTFGADLKVNLIPDTLRFVGDLKFAWVGFTESTEFEGLTTREVVSPYWIESDAAYIDVIGLIPTLDMRVGRQIVHWGAADMFNPTNNLNSLDLEDPIMFGETIANQMIRLDWYPGDGNFIFTGVWVPVFQPAALPGSAMLAIGDTSAELPFVNPRDRLDAERLRNIWLRNPEAYEVAQPNVTADMPAFSLKNSQVGIKVQWLAGLFDMSLSYYRGYDGMPVTRASLSSTYSTGVTTENGTPVLGVATDARLVYPRKHVVGFDLAGQLPFLDDAGLWFEGALIFPEEIKMSFDVTAVAPGARVIVGPTVANTPFYKYTIGSDYSFNEYLFVTAQFVHGFPDEFGAHAIHDYLVGGFDLKFIQEKLLIRIFFVGELPHDDDDLPLDDDGDGMVESFAKGATDDGTISALVFFPQITTRPVDGLELTLGGYLPFGHRESKLAQPAAGPSLAFFRARASF
jgi:hypothetical protein